MSVLIPALNEAEFLPALLADLSAQQGLRLEVLVADGGSRDATPSIAKRQAARLIKAERGRAAQLNAAAAAAGAPWLLCLHADSRLSQPTQLATALALMRKARRRQTLVAGHWPLRFNRCAPGHRLLFAQMEAKSTSNRPGTVNGDQGLMIHRESLAQLGGFDTSLPFFEDQRLAKKVFAEGQMLLLPGVIETSARRFEVEGHTPRLVLMALIVGAETGGLHDWLAALPGLYQQQADAAELHAAPFMASLSAHIHSLPAARQQALWRAVGGLLTGNAWQLALLLDNARGNAEQTGLQAYDRWLAPRLMQPPWPALAGGLMSLAIHLGARFGLPR